MLEKIIASSLKSVLLYYKFIYLYLLLMKHLF